MANEFFEKFYRDLTKEIDRLGKSIESKDPAVVSDILTYIQGIKTAFSVASSFVKEEEKIPVYESDKGQKDILSVPVYKTLTDKIVDLLAKTPLKKFIKKSTSLESDAKISVKPGQFELERQKIYIFRSDLENAKQNMPQVISYIKATGDGGAFKSLQEDDQAISGFIQTTINTIEEPNKVPYFESNKEKNEFINNVTTSSKENINDMSMERFLIPKEPDKNQKLLHVKSNEEKTNINFRAKIYDVYSKPKTDQESFNSTKPVNLMNIKFRSLISSKDKKDLNIPIILTSLIGEQVSPTIETITIPGKTENIFKSSGASRTISIGFQVISENVKNFEENILLINWLTKACYPGPLSGGNVRDMLIVEINIINVFYPKIVGYISSFSWEVPQDSPWILENSWPLIIPKAGYKIVQTDKPRNTFFNEFKIFVHEELVFAQKISNSYRDHDVTGETLEIISNEPEEPKSPIVVPGFYMLDESSTNKLRSLNEQELQNYYINNGYEINPNQWPDLRYIPLCININLSINIISDIETMSPNYNTTFLSYTSKTS